MEKANPGEVVSDGRIFPTFEEAANEIANRYLRESQPVASKSLIPSESSLELLDSGVDVLTPGQRRLLEIEAYFWEKAASHAAADFEGGEATPFADLVKDQIITEIHELNDYYRGQFDWHIEDQKTVGQFISGLMELLVDLDDQDVTLPKIYLRLAERIASFQTPIILNQAIVAADEERVLEIARDLKADIFLRSPEVELA